MRLDADNNVTDPLTKALALLKYESHTISIGVRNMRDDIIASGNFYELCPMAIQVIH